MESGATRKYLKNQTFYTMKKLLTIIGLAVATLSGANAAAFTAGNLAVSRVGDGSTTLANSGGPMSLLEFTTTGIFVQNIIVSSTVSSGLQTGGTAVSEGAISLSANGQSLTLAGYIPPFGSAGSLSGRNSTDAPRGYVTIGADGSVSSPTTLGTAFSGNNIRSGVATASGVYFAGGNTGTIYSSGGNNTTIQSSNANTRVANVINGNLTYSTGSGTQGIYGFTGTPTTATIATSIITGLTGQGTSPYDFTFNSLNTVAYVADNNVGIQKFTFNGTVWSLAYNITTASTGLTGLAVDFSGVNPTIFAVNPSNLWSYTDIGAGAMTSIATAGDNYAFRGLDFAPIPEPSTFGAIALGAISLLGARRLRRKVA